MTNRNVEELVKRALFDVAPDLEAEPLDPDAPYNEQFEFDSMDFLNFVMALHRATGLDFPEKDYPELVTVAKAVSYLEGKLPDRG